MLQVQRKNSVFLTDLEEFPHFQTDDYSLKIDVRYLSEKSRKRAETELNETDDNKKDALENFSKLITGEENLDVPHDNIPLMLKFLRARKFNVNLAFELMKSYFKFKEEFPQMFQDVVPSECAYIYAMNAAVISPIKDQHGHTVFMGRAEMFDPNIATPMEFITAAWVIGEGIIMEPETQVNGFVGVIDCKGFSYQHFKKITLSLMKLVLRLSQSVFPFIPRRIHLINQNFYISAIYKIIKPFLPQEYIDIIHFHGDNLAELYEYVPKECLTESFGGTMRDLQITEAEYREFLSKFDAEYLALNALGYKRT